MISSFGHPGLAAVAQARNEPQTASRGLLETLAGEPALVQLCALLLIVVVGWSVLARLGRLAREARARAAVRDYLIGVEQALSGNLKGAVRRLERVLAEDPENHHARLLYGIVLADLGEPGDAHKQHVQLHRGFGVRSLRNELALARNLLEVGRPGEAVEPAVRAVEAHPDAVEPRRVLFRCQLAAGFPEEAGRTGQELARLLPPGSERDRVSGEAARALALAARVRLGAGDVDGARRLLAVAERDANADDRALRLLSVRIELFEHGEQAMWSHLHRLALPAPDRAERTLLPAVRDEDSPTTELLAAVVPLDPYSCRRCGGGLAAAGGLCPQCGATDAGRPLEPPLFQELDSPARTVDAIEANSVHVERLCVRVLADDRSAAIEILELGVDAVEHVLAQAIEKGTEETRFTELLQRMGPSILPTLFDVYQRRKDDWRARFGELFARGSTVGVVGRVVQGFGEEALPHFEPLLGTADRELRKIIIDYYVGLGDTAEFHRVLGEFPPVELIHRLNEAPPAVLTRFLCSLDGDSFVAQVLLPDQGFCRDVDLLDAAADAPNSSVLTGILVRRGFNRGLIPVLIDRLGEPRLGSIANAVLDSYGAPAISHLVPAFADLDLPDRVRGELGSRLAAIGVDAVPRLCDCFSATATPLDQELVALFAAMGEGALEALREAYRQGSLLEKFAGPFRKRHTHRRTMIIRAIAAIDGPASQIVLREMRESETDPNLKLRLSQALHRVGGAERSDDSLDDDAAGEDAPGDDAPGEGDGIDRGGHGQVG